MHTPAGHATAACGLRTGGRQRRRSSQRMQHNFQRTVNLGNIYKQNAVTHEGDIKYMHYIELGYPACLAEGLGGLELHSRDAGLPCAQDVCAPLLHDRLGKHSYQRCRQ